MPVPVVILAFGFAVLCLTIQVWRLESITASYDQALFLQELWSTAQGCPFESSLSSVLSAAVKVHGELPSVGYLHLGQHSNFLTLLLAPLVALLGSWVLPFVQVSVLTAAGLVLWRIAARRLPESLAIRITAAYFLSGAVIGPAFENFHDLIWLPLLGFLVVEGLLEQKNRQLVLASALLLLVREDSGLVLFSLGLWAVLRQSGARWKGVGLMAVSFLWVLLVTGWIQPSVDSSVIDRFLQEKFGHLVTDESGGSTIAALAAMLRNPLALVQALVSPPGETLGFLLALSLPLVLIPLLSVDSALLMAAPLFIALALGLTLTLVANPHRSLSALVPDSFSPWVHVSPLAMLERRAALREAVSFIPKQASVSADTPVLPLLAQREALIRFPNSTQYLDRAGVTQSVDWVVTFPGCYTPLAPVFRLERNLQRSIGRKLSKLVASGNYQLMHCHKGTVVLRRVSPQTEPSTEAVVDPSSCSWLN